MAATDLFRRAPPAPAGALPQTPALLRDGGQPERRKGAGQGHLLAGVLIDATEPPARSRAPSASRARAQAPPLPPSGNRRHHQGLPDEEMPTPQATAWRGHRRTNTHHYSEQMFDKTRQENLPTWLSKGATSYRR